MLAAMRHAIVNRAGVVVESIGLLVSLSGALLAVAFGRALLALALGAVVLGFFFRLTGRRRARIGKTRPARLALCRQRVFVGRGGGCLGGGDKFAGSLLPRGVRALSLGTRAHRPARRLLAPARLFSGVDRKTRGESLTLGALRASIARRRNENTDPPMIARRCLALWVKLPLTIACRGSALRESLARMPEEAMIRVYRRLEPTRPDERSQEIGDVEGVDDA